MKFTLGKEERLKSRKIIGELYKRGQSVKAYPLRMVYLQIEHHSNFPVRAAVSVPKRNFKKAVDRNRIKRLLRETYRSEKEIIYTKAKKPYVFMISYIAKEELPHQELKVKMTKLLTKFVNEINDYEE